MTIEEYLRKRIEEETKIFLTTDRPETGLIYFKGVIDGLKEILSKLPEMEHEVTVREVSELCGDCSNCPYPVSPADPAGCYLNDTPDKWPVDEIQKRVKETRK